MGTKYTAEYRKKHAVGNHGDFPIADRVDAVKALKLRGHAKTAALRRAIIRRAAKYAPAAAKAALAADKKSGALK